MCHLHTNNLLKIKNLCRQSILGDFFDGLKGAASGTARLAVARYVGIEPANSRTRYHREAVANLLNG
jgi:hypothetical protein